MHTLQQHLQYTIAVLLYSVNEKQNTVRVLIYQAYANTQYVSAYLHFGSYAIGCLTVSACFFVLFFFFASPIMHRICL